MPDPRHQKLAKVMVHYSLNIQPGDKLLLVGGEIAAPLIREIYREALRAGAFVDVQVALEGLREILFVEGTEEQLSYISILDRAVIEHYNKFVSILSSQNTKSLGGIEPKRLALRSKTRAPLQTQLMEKAALGKLDWSLTLYPTYGYAQDAGMSLSDYEDFVYGAGLLDLDDPAEGWRKVRAEQQRIADYLAQHNEIHIVAPGTDITYRVGGRRWINADGSSNFPDGEVFTGPIEDSANGTVRYTYPAIYNGNQVEGIELTFEHGKVVAASATKGADFLHAMLDMDAGSRFLGEVAFGLNYGIKQFTGTILFDEKIGGTMHMALGASYPETGGENESGLHWDMICDLREGKVYADGELCYEEGKFVL